MKRIWLVLSFVALTVGTAKANTMYTFDITAPATFSGDTFSLITASPITVDTIFTSSQLTCNMCSAVYFYVDAVADGLTPSPPSQAIGYMLTTPGHIGTEVFFYFDPGSFPTPGIYDSIPFSPGISQSAILTVSDTAIPEPSSFLLLASGLAGLAGMVRSKLKA